ncbi:isochorismate synthase [Lutibacter sp.]|uniref:isochorismate synthase n=1 Tax=Lutibacter sp. TaxID=1925666 RepID=UPI0034A02581
MNLSCNIDTFFEKVSEMYNTNLPFVVFRKPNDTKITALCQNSSVLYVLKSFEESGFIFSPFNKNESKILFPFNYCDKIFAAVEKDFNVTEIESGFKVDENPEAKKQHISIVQNAIDFINTNQAKKIVLSRKEKVSCNAIEVFDVLKKMLNNYKNAFVYVWFHPKVGLWMGATPERLISIDKQLNLKTMALAGTQKFNETLQVEWQEKELLEQQYVTDYILENIKDKTTKIETKGPYTVKAGSLLHLRTDISANLKASNLLGNLINSLHPTPAICGIPQNIATDFILKHENYNRVFYSGYLGELNINNTTNLFVNLRCMKIKENKATLYIGGGITTKSIAENEWNETVAKAEIMKRVL